WIARHFKGGDGRRPENLTFSPPDGARESALDKADRHWRQRLDSNRAEILLNVRDTMTALAALARHHRCLVWNADDGLLLWEVARRTPEGVTCGVCRTQKGREILEQYGRTLGDLDKPVLQFRPETASQGFLTPERFRSVLLQFQYNGAVFDRLFFRDPFISEESAAALARALAAAAFPKRQAGAAFTDEQEAEQAVSYDADAGTDGADDVPEPESPLTDGWTAVIAQKIPAGGQRIARLIKGQVLTPETAAPYAEALGRMERAEEEFFGGGQNPLFSWNAASIADEFRSAGFHVECASQTAAERRRITAQELDRWFDAETSAYGRKMLEAVGAQDLQKLRLLLESAAQKLLFSWQTETAFLAISAPGAAEAGAPEE
ncbi:MAG: recombinase RarA, partial [Treponemataceae bacterium]|nr:recombinase RarA [Treponemataceae bacterium]